MVPSCTQFALALLAQSLLVARVLAQETKTIGGLEKKRVPYKVPSDVWEMFMEVNALRKQGFQCSPNDSYPPNYTPMSFNCGLYRSATLHSEDMAIHNYFNHISQDGRMPFERAEAQGQDLWSENIAAGSAEVQWTMNQFKTSVEHCKNMMDPGAKSFGAGHGYSANSQWHDYWTQDFGNAPDMDTSCYPSGPSPGPPSPPPSSCPSGCSDQDPGCPAQKTLGYCSPDSGAHYTYSQSYCKCTCGFCGSPSPPPTPCPPGCSDQDPGCPAQKAMGYCSPDSGSHYAWSQSYCKCTCGFCSPSCPPGCSDQDSGCPAQKALGYCSPNSGAHYTYSQSMCKCTCGFCGRGAIGGQAPAKVRDGLVLGQNSSALVV
eukprot:TRINITY_DN3611_c0_g1_i1.p1 TRINITY_DN3611_c0_g1~~TRINITY_DN3611_c0_g1_i1.p1  ORF type:complete len:393 (-),score=42.14 TRINITY_DN3611_c0_g1_i1:72-1190(-)